MTINNLTNPSALPFYIKAISTDSNWKAKHFAIMLMCLYETIRTRAGACLIQQLFIKKILDSYPRLKNSNNICQLVFLDKIFNYYK